MGTATGSRESPTINLESTGVVGTSTIAWTYTLNGGSITIETNVSLDGGSTWKGWKTCSNNSAIPDLPSGTDVNQGRLKVRQTLTGSDGMSPQLHSLNVTLMSQDIKNVKETGADKTEGKSLSVLVDRYADQIEETDGRKWAGESGADVTETQLKAVDAIVNGKTMIVNGFLSTDFIAADAIAAEKLVITDIDALLLSNGPNEAGADNTKEQLDVGVVVDQGGQIKLIGSGDSPASISLNDSSENNGISIRMSDTFYDDGSDVLVFNTYDPHEFTNWAPTKLAFDQFTDMLFLMNDQSGSITFKFVGENLLDTGVITKSIVIHDSYFYVDDRQASCGTSSNRWTEVFAYDGTINTSDEKEKTEIQQSDLGLNFVDLLRPISFRWLDGSRTHYSVSAQSVEEAVESLGKTDMDFAGYTKSLIEREDGSTFYRYGTRAHELIAPMATAIQELHTKVKYLEEKINERQPT